MATASKSGDKPAKPVTQSLPKTAKPAAKTVKPKSATATKPKSASATKPQAAKQPAAPKAVAEKKAAAPARKAAVAARGKSVANLMPDQRRYYVEVAAYYIAERRGFHGGSEMDDWVRAESEIDRLVREGILKP